MFLGLYAFSRDIEVVYPDIEIALWKRPFALLDTRSENTLWPPADSPNIVTLSGAPPNFEMLSFTHFRAITISKVPKLEVLSSSFWNLWIAGCVNQPKGPNL